ncbi:DNA polymerase III subunit delta [Pararhodobacter zhoushanensis]|uniref:DNA polymerase III subunit delta n=1 Tax=Pararhodobacter zhoushanensis TaxID=2479545 RepID=UPI000F8C36F7|nr:DNA polymerase III subunit delta [Pararhodobacter zhoushanensis]
MKLSPRDAEGFLARPDPRVPALLIYGADAMRVSEKRAKLVATIVGPKGDAEMRLTRMPGSDLRKDPSAAVDAAKAQGFFPGARAVVIDEANDHAVTGLKAVLDEWAEGDAMLVITAGQLTPGSKLRKLFEGDKRARVLAIYDDPPGRAEIEGMLRAEGLESVPQDALRDLVALGQLLEPGDFRQTLTRIALYKLSDNEPLTTAEIAMLAPQSNEAEIDDILDALAEGRMADLAPILSRLAAQGVQPVAVCIGAARHFRMLHALVSAPGGPSQAIQSLRPPVFGPRRDKLLRQAQNWSLSRVEDALRDLTATDLMLRSSTHAPTRALAERALIRLARMAGRR